MAGKIMVGARALVYAVSADGSSRLVGIFNSVSYGQANDAQPSFILGRYGAASIDYTAQEPVNISANGWRAIGHGAHTAPGLPKLEDLLHHEYMSFQILDRGTNQVMATITEVRPLGQNGSVAARQLSELGINYTGLLLGDESGTPAWLEDGTASDLPS